MEARKITIVSTKTQKKSVIISGAETLGELKRDLREANIDYDGMTFYEGTSKTELKTDESVLPKDVPYTNRTTGETKNTNELVFMLTNTNKKIKSGVKAAASLSMTRQEAYDAVKKNNLQAECLKRFGKNFTVCSTADLISLIESNCTFTSPAPVVGSVDIKARAAISNLVKLLEYNDILNESESNDVLDVFSCNTKTPTVSENYSPDSSSPYCDNEIDAMFRDVC